MAYQPRIKTPRKYGRRHEKVKSKTTEQKYRSSGNYLSEEKHIPTLEEIVNKTLNRLRILGSQRFVLSPFNGHFSRWLVDLRYVLSEFESNSNIEVDDQFVKERSQILSNIELDLEERRSKETSQEETIGSLSDKRILLKRIEEEYTTKSKEIERRKDSEIRCLSSNIDDLREELDRIARMKAGIFRVISKKARAQKEADTTQRLNNAQRELTLAIQSFAAEQEKIRDEYERRRQPVIEQIQDQQKEIENQEIDGSLESRRAASEALVNAVNVLLYRNLQNRKP